MKTISLLKAVLTEDMNLFKYNTSKNSSKRTKILIPLVLFLIICFSIGTYAYNLAEILYKANLTFVMLSLFIIIVSVLAFVEGIYKSQGILFEAKDNDLLFSLPIKRSKILFVRIFKLMSFEYLYNLMFILPAFVVYIYFEKPGVSFYILSILMTFLIPIIPTVLSSIIGYIIKMVSSKFRFKKIIQTVLTSIIFMLFISFSFNSESIMTNLVNNATSINDLLTKLYYPLGLYVSLIFDFDIITFIKLILVNILPLVLFILIGQKFYFKIIFASNKSKVKNNKKVKFNLNKPMVALTKKELKRYFSSPVYMFNTSFSLILMVVLSVVLSINGNTDMISAFANIGIDEGLSMEIIYYMLVSFLLLSTSITSSSISLEGKTINITKSLPIDYKKIFKSKLLTSFLIEFPFMFISLMIFTINLKVSLPYFIFLITLAVAIILFTGSIGLIINLKYPKLNASNDTEVVKQSMSSMISVFLGMGIFIVSIIIIGLLSKYLEIKLLLLIHVLIMVIASYISYFILMKNGPKEYQELNV